MLVEGESEGRLKIYIRKIKKKVLSLAKIKLPKLLPKIKSYSVISQFLNFAEAQSRLVYVYLRKYSGLILLSLFVFLGNSLPRNSVVALGSDLVEISSNEASSIVGALSDYTPGLLEDKKLVSSSFDGNGNFFDGKPLSEVQREPIKYEVQKGDTYSSIGGKYNLHVATILDANGIDPKSTLDLKSGTILTIPFEDTSTSTAYLDAENQIKEERRRKQLEEQRKKESQRLARRRGTTSVQRASAGFDGDGGGGLIVPIRHNGVSRGVSRFHTGIDYRADRGTPVVAAAAGKIIELTSGWGSGYGISVVVDHGGGQTTRYAHLSKYTVGIGDYVEQGEVLGYSGSSGFSTGPHLHFEERINGRVVSPF